MSKLLEQVRECISLKKLREEESKFRWGELSEKLDASLRSLDLVALEKALEDAEWYRHYCQMVKDNPMRAQALIWESKPSRNRFDAAIDAARKEKP